MSTSPTAARKPVHRLILIKHSLPQVQDGVLAADWELSEAGRRRCDVLASALQPLRPQHLVCSQEPKALQTARLTAERLAVPWQPHPGLHEHVRPERGLLSRTNFEHRVAEFFARPGELVYGQETANQAHERFSQAVISLFSAHPAEIMGIVAHGTVITLFVSRRNGINPFGLWESLGLPSFVVLSLPDLKLIEVVNPVQKGL